MNYLKSLFLVFLIGFFNLSIASELSLREKIGQMLIVGFEGKTASAHSTIARWITEDNIGGVILFDYNYQNEQFDKNIKSPKQLKSLDDQLQKINDRANQDYNRPPLPLIISIDYEGGAVNRLSERYGFPPIPSAEDIGKENNTIHAGQVAQTMAETLSKAGINLNFSPIVDLNINPANPIIGQLKRSFSSDPKAVSLFASIYSRYFLNNGVECAYKHFPGHGSSTTDSHLDFVDVSSHWTHSELEPYQNLLNKINACGMVMIAHVINRQLDDSGLPATLSYSIVNGILRNQLAFNGVVISDDMQMNAIRKYYGIEKALTLAINAGVDMLVFGNQLVEKPQDPKELINIIEAKVKSGEISEERINQAYEHITKLKGRLSQYEFK